MQGVDMNKIFHHEKNNKSNFFIITEEQNKTM